MFIVIVIAMIFRAYSNFPIPMLIQVNSLSKKSFKKKILKFLNQFYEKPLVLRFINFKDWIIIRQYTPLFHRL